MPLQEERMGAPNNRTDTNVSISKALLNEAAGTGLNVSGLTEAALGGAIRQERAHLWQQENAAALLERQDWIARNGLPLADVQVLRV